MQAFGVLYLVDRNPLFRRMLQVSMESLRRVHPDWPVQVIETPSPPVGPLRALYRRATWWKRARREARAGQDVRVLAAKAEAWLQSPFEQTLFLDADTVVLRSLEALRARAQSADVLACPLPWKQYQALEPWQPASFPYLMSGAVFYNRRFADAYRGVLRRIRTPVAALPTGDQFVFSLTVALAPPALRVQLEPSLQLDVINMRQHAGGEALPLVAGDLDLRWPGLERFHVFHYNDRKPQYLDRIRTVWGLPAHEP